MTARQNPHSLASCLPSTSLSSQHLTPLRNTRGLFFRFPFLARLHYNRDINLRLMLRLLTSLIIRHLPATFLFLARCISRVSSIFLTIVELSIPLFVVLIPNFIVDVELGGPYHDYHQLTLSNLSKKDPRTSMPFTIPNRIPRYIKLLLAARINANCEPGNELLIWD